MFETSYSSLRALAIMSATVSALALSACGSGSTATNSATSAASSAMASATASADAKPTVSDAWAKAGTKGGMTGLFATLKNPTSAPLTVVGVSSDAGRAELHTTVKTPNGMQMKKTEKFVIPANDTFELKPGGNHIMLLDLKKDLKAGDNVRVTIKTSTGTTTDITASVRAFAGGNESYGSGMPSMDHSGMSGMNHSGMPSVSGTDHSNMTGMSPMPSHK